MSEGMGSHSPQGNAVAESIIDVEHIGDGVQEIEVNLDTDNVEYFRMDTLAEDVALVEGMSSKSPRANVVAESIIDVEHIGNEVQEVATIAPERGEEVALAKGINSSSPRGSVDEAIIEEAGTTNNVQETEVAAVATECREEVALAVCRPGGDLVEDVAEVDCAANRGPEIEVPLAESVNSPQCDVAEAVTEAEHVVNKVRSIEVEEAVPLLSHEEMLEGEASAGKSDYKNKVTGNQEQEQHQHLQQAQKQDQEPTRAQEAQRLQDADSCVCHDPSGFSDRTTAASTETEPAAPVGEATGDLEALEARLRQEGEELHALRSAITECKQESTRLMEKHAVREREATVAPSWWRAELVAIQSQVSARYTQLGQHKLCLEDRHAQALRLVGARTQRIQELERQVASLAHTKGNEATPRNACSDGDTAVLRARQRLLEDKQQYAAGLRLKVESQDARVQQLLNDLQGTLTFMVKKMLKAEGRRISLTEGGGRGIHGSHGGADIESPSAALERRLGLSSYGCEALRVASDRASIAGGGTATWRSSFLAAAGSGSPQFQKVPQQQLPRSPLPQMASCQSDEALEERLSVMVRTRPLAKSRVRWGRHTITGGSRPLGLEQTV